MSFSDRFTDADILRVQPALLGIIRWKKAIGRPAGDLCGGFRIVVEERTPSKFREGPGGIEVIPGTGEWRPFTDSAPCTAAPDTADSYNVRFTVPGVHLNFFDGKYRVAPQLTGNWDKSVFRYVSGPPSVEPRSWHVVLTKDRPVESIDFEVIRRSLFRFAW